ncbi:alpha-1,6-mannosyl-glycoprotein 2-beta-N-acetylglucosaminyltransferase-like, partial [Ostrinia furnacalis]|uniref:alpha-1,6-mannosyl-glycoprotein 2-beta-N-acetylglucosaminyltransferase-like n=1 Tax=Ostrinia furnacalis TaxID=93504 RepID=UPI00103C7297
MFPIRHVFTKLKQVAVSAVRIRLDHVVFAACLVAFVWLCWGGLESTSSYVPSHLQKYLLFPEDYKILEKQLSKAELKKLTLKVEQLNAHVEVINWDKYRPVNSETTIIVILVHKDVERLQHLIISLGQVHGIHQVLIIFSHSYFETVINDLVKSIDFCKVMQIFYPHSLQLNPNKFPGIDPTDCNATSLLEDIGSPGRLHCVERDARRTQRKQHWWWTANYVFEALEWSSSKQMTVFLEEDSYALPDLLHMLEFARRVLPYFPAVQLLALGRPPADDLEYDMLTVDAWSPPYDRGLAFNKTTWRKIAARASLYCFYDDCSWSYSLVHLFRNFTDGFAEMAACSAPRVLSTSVFASGRRAARFGGGGVHGPCTPGRRAAGPRLPVPAAGRQRRLNNGIVLDCVQIDDAESHAADETVV